jgi:5-methylcytosine-specific restriction endonuclease McrA
MQSLPSLAGKHPSWLNSNIRNLNRTWNKELTKLPCPVCGYAIHVELCHKIPISKFPKTATLGEVNHPSNIIQLCRNHHWEFDHGILELP